MKCRKLGNWAMALCVTAMGGAAQAGTVTIDGVIDLAEIAGLTAVTIGNGGGTAYFRADGDYIYGAFDITGWTSAMGSTSHGNLLGFGVWAANGSAGTSGNGVEFQQATNPATWGGGSSGTMNGLESAFRLDGGSPAASIPGNLQAYDSFTSGPSSHRVWEVLMPIVSMGLLPTDSLWVVGGINYSGTTHWYGAPWANPNPLTYIEVARTAGSSPLTPAVVPVPAAAGLGMLGMSLVAFVRRRKNAKA